MTLTRKSILLTLFGFILVVLALAAAVAFMSPAVYGASSQVPGVTIHTINPPQDTQDFYTFFIATTTTATSTSASSTQDPGFLRIGGAKDVLFYFSRGDLTGHGNSGSTAFKVQVTPDGTNWFDYNELGLIGVSATADTFFARVASVTISAATSTVQYAMEDIAYYGVRCIATKTTDGEATCKATAGF